VTSAPDLPHTENVVQLPVGHAPSRIGADPAAPGAGGHGGAVPPNTRAYDYEGARQPPDRPTSAGPPLDAPIPLHPAAQLDAHADALRARAAEVTANLEPFGSHGPVPQPHELVPPPRDARNPFGDFFSDGPSAWLEDEDEVDGVMIDQPRVVGTTLAVGAIVMSLAAWAVWGRAMYEGAGGAEAGGFVLISMLLWVWYLSLPRSRQHRTMLQWHERISSFIDRRVSPLRSRTEGQLLMRRERDRYRAMRDERTRRVNALGEGAFRAFRQGTLPIDLQSGAQRVLAMERQMLEQDRRIHELVDERDTSRAARSKQAAPEPSDGHDLA